MRWVRLATPLLLAILVASTTLPPATAAPQLARHYPQVEAELRAIETAHPELAKVKSIGKSSLGFELWHITLTDLTVNGPKYKVYMDGGHHGNEVLGVEMVFLYINYLVLGYESKDPDVLNLLRQYEFHLTPMLNPDGNVLDTRKNGNQVDLNRNYPYEWGTDGASADITAQNYHGAAPLSESEIRANTELARKFSWDVWITMHTGVAEFYWPWSYTNDDPPDHEMFVSAEKPFEAATNNRVDAMQSAELYIADGDTEDFGYGELGIPSFVFEVHEDQFVPVYPEELTGVLRDQFNGLKWVVANTPRYGANLSVSLVSIGNGFLNLSILNDGFGAAHELDFEVLVNGAVVAERSGGFMHDSVLAPGDALSQSFPYDGVGGMIEVRGSYPQLFINSTRTKTLAYSSGEASMAGLEDGFSRVPGFEVVLVLVAAATNVFSRGRRS